jgi:hypothetical protein
MTTQILPHPAIRNHQFSIRKKMLKIKEKIIAKIYYPIKPTMMRAMIRIYDYDNK